MKKRRSHKTPFTSVYDATFYCMTFPIDCVLKERMYALEAGKNQSIESIWSGLSVCT
jgi:hypothetical protein